MTMNKVQIEDCQNIGKLGFIDWNELKNATILVTGSTGLIGSNLVNALAFNNKEKGLNIKLVLLVRNVEAAKALFGWTEAEIVRYEIGQELKIEKSVDYIVHLASPTSSKFFVECPADTMLANIDGYKTLLDWAVKQPVKKFIGMSTMEVYGLPPKGHKVKENELGAFETMNARNSYPIAKIACETLCHSYHIQYGVPSVILRATQTFGPGVKYDDGRVFAQFMRCAIEKKDIVLKTKGETERSYLYTADAVSAIIAALIKGQAGEAYTIANPETYCSIKEMAGLVANKIANDEIKIVFDLNRDVTKQGYADTLYMDLDVAKIQSLGWKPQVNLLDMYKRMIRSVQTNF